MPDSFFPLAAYSIVGVDTFIPARQCGPTAAFADPAKPQTSTKSGTTPPAPFSPPAVHSSVLRGDTMVSAAQLSDEERRLKRIGNALQKYYDKVGVEGRSDPDRIAEAFATAVCGILGVKRHSNKVVDGRKPHGPSYAFALQCANDYLGAIDCRNGEKNRYGRRRLGAAYALVLSIEGMRQRRALSSSSP